MIEVIGVSFKKTGKVYYFDPGRRVIEKGQTSLDESALTGESIPVDKKDGDKVFSGTCSVRQTRDISSSVWQRKNMSRSGISLEPGWQMDRFQGSRWIFTAIAPFPS